MDIRIGIINSARELNFESSQTAAEIQALVAKAVDSDAKYFSLADDKGSLYLVPVASFGYIEIGAETPRRVGFVA
ncbi:DUF3107 domain-containing protein [Homoserinimonas hongtaonis]|uniref:DUF3107 domain-containing protein n=1 Tax=Homoserinimonas hongtaonis TaxID=2079791 RepID=A0A2U1SWY7_9MICO|nr:DUF3107 domain-containing protein [Salinibacterium hongtaonis]AWB88706.1 DUF3107 domain-containing protein [Salinibacterium hongtaonis]PWB96116.1 DUF3107 domain-containing protein [Salinibacterium hongtaonis]